MKFHAIASVLALAALTGALGAGVAEARNPNCAGGIQYVVQAMRDKDKGNTEDYVREINKAVSVLEKCLQEDPVDFEAIGYLGWAYAEVESAGPGGVAFETARAGLEAKGDKKKLEWLLNNRDSYWARWFNEGIAKIQAAQQAYDPFCKAPENDADVTLRGEAEKSYRDAELAVQKAALLRPGHAQTTRSLASVQALQCRFREAAAILAEGIKASPGDSSLQEALVMVRANMASRLVDEKKFDEALAFYREMLAAEPTNADHHLSIADVHFRRAQTVQGDAQKADFAAAGEGYGRAGEMRAGDRDLLFNSALAFQNAQVWDRAAAQWEKVVALNPADPEALSALGAALVEVKRCPEAISAVHKAVSLKPQDKTYHRQLGAIYTRCGNNARATDELMIYLSMQNGAAVADAATHAKGARQGTDAAKTLASEGLPEQVYTWEADKQKYETWFYFAKKRAFHFMSTGAQSRNSDWSAAETQAAAGTTKK